MFVFVYAYCILQASNMAAAKFLDAISRMPGNGGEDSDATGAYWQALLGGTETWVRIPRDRWPKAWHAKYERPVCRLRLSLYGHPLAGLYWEILCTDVLLSEGFEKIPGWECLFVHHEWGMVLSVYVDDFKLAGPSKHINKVWTAIQQHINLDKIEPFKYCP